MFEASRYIEAGHDEVLIFYKKLLMKLMYF